MKNQELAKIFYEIADFLEMEEVAFKPYAYQKAAVSLETLEEDVAYIYKRGGLKALEKIPGVGKSIAEKIEEYLKTGKIKHYQDLKKKMPVQIEELIAIEGVGPKTVKALYKSLKIKNIEDLEKAARAHKIRGLPGFQEKTEKNILQGIAFLKRSKGRFLLGEILPQVKEILEQLKDLKEVEQISVAGSVRRMKETIGDVDILAVSRKPEKVMDFFVSMPGVIKVWSKGPTRSSIRVYSHTKNFGVGVEQGFDIDLRVVAKKSYGSALQYFTGSKEHNIATRRIAIEKGLKLNEYGVFKNKNLARGKNFVSRFARNKKMIAGWRESGVYRAIGLFWMPPELRENQGEIEASLRNVQGKSNGLPKIIGYQDIKGDLHCHSDWDGGNNSIEEIAEAAQQMGYEYLGITDHTKFLRIEQGLDERQLDQQRKEIGKINTQYIGREADSPQCCIQNTKFKILQGAETNILNDGSIDIKDEALKKLDYAIAGIHSSFKLPKAKMTERIIKAMKNPYIKIISHPTGRILKKRDEYQCDFEKVLRAAREFGIILEINSQPRRLDINDRNIRRAKEMGIKMVINTDAHHISHLRFMDLGIAQARRGWAEKKDIINAQPLDKLLKILK